jgi:hypothetical protein
MILQNTIRILFKLKTKELIQSLQKNRRYLRNICIKNIA